MQKNLDDSFQRGKMLVRNQQFYVLRHRPKEPKDADAILDYLTAARRIPLLEHIARSAYYHEENRAIARAVLEILGAARIGPKSARKFRSEAPLAETALEAAQ